MGIEFEGKKFDERTIELINNFINEFDELFGKYISREEVIKRINENLNDSIIFCEFDNKWQHGGYYSKEKCIRIKPGLDEENLKSVIFHELIHCITAQDKNVGFRKHDYIEYKGYKESIGIGINEGTAQYLTKIRNARYSPNLKGEAYPILTKQVENLIEIIGEDKFLNVFFNSSEELLNILNDNFEFDIEYDAEDFLKDFDVLWNNENMLAFNRFARIGRINDIKVNNATANIIKTYCNKQLSSDVSTVKEVEELYRNIEMYISQLGDGWNITLLNEVLQKITQLKEHHLSNQEIIEQLPEDIRKVFELELEVEKFSRMETLDKLKNISNLETPIMSNLYEVIDISFDLFRIFQGKIMIELYEHYGIKNDEFEVLFDLAPKIIEKGYKFEDLSIEVFEDEYGNRIYKLFEGVGENKREVDLLYKDDINGIQPVELKKMTAEEKKDVAEELESIISEKDSIYIDVNGNIIINNEDGQYTKFDNDEVMEYINSEYIPSITEELQERIDSSLQRIEKLKRLKAPAIIIQKEESLLKERQEKLREVSKRIVDSKQIEQATIDQGVSLDGIETATNILRGLEEEKEKGVEPYDE